jgi:outer membrane protein TolC
MEIELRDRIEFRSRIKITIRNLTSIPILILISILLLILPTSAETNVTRTIDLPTALKLAGAQNLDVSIARAKLAEARATHEGTMWQFFPWISPGFAYRAHDNAIQNVEGKVIDVHRESYTLGPTVMAQWDLGDAIYKELAARQLAKAAEHALDAQRQDAIAAAATGYFDLARAQAGESVAREAVRIANGYVEQLERAVEAGIVFKGDALRARTQLERNQFSLRQAQEQQRLAAARLAQTLRLDPMIELGAKEDELVPLPLLATNAAIESLVSKALANRPELRQSQSLVDAAKKTRDGARYGPWVPSVGAQVFAGGLAGGNQSTYRGLSESEDYQVTLGWRIGPGGLFDRSRVRAAEARWNTVVLTGQKLQDEIVRQVVEGFTRVQSEADKLATLRRGLAAAEQTFRLARERKEFAVGVVLETIQAEQELTRLRHDYFNTVGEFNKAQYQLLKAIGSATASEATGK